MLHKTISAIRAETWEADQSGCAVSSARQEKLETATVVRIDSTVTEALMHEPSDSSLLWDAVRVMVRLLKEADELPAAPGSSWRNHRRAGQEARAGDPIHAAARRNGSKLYRELIAVTRATLAYAPAGRAQRLAAAPHRGRGLAGRGPALSAADRADHRAEPSAGFYVGEAVPASEKLVSLFEPHADIIVKGGRERCTTVTSST